ncbi:MAG: hypothetical protein IKT05_07945 [Fibrobacter sp.]|nr:hypothetical protein [Fibrobacter sp.]
MLYKHWKKIALAVTSFFWASCDNTSSANDDNSPESSSSIETPKSSSATAAPNSSAETGNTTSSSSVEQPTSSEASANPASSSEAAVPKSSSSVEQAASSSSEDNQNVASSASEENSSSSLGAIITPKYGVVIRSSSSEELKPESSSSAEIVAPKYGVMKPTCERMGTTLRCDDGVTCEEKTKTEYGNPECIGDFCPEYGVIEISKTTYTCDNGKVYNEAEFRSKYDILDGAVDLYGCPSDICGKITDEEQN